MIFLVGSAFAANLVVNGDFEAGNTGFTSDYYYVSSTGPFALYNTGTYTVGSDPSNYNSYWNSFGAYDGTLMLIANGASTANQNVWSQVVPVTTNTSYDISFWVASNLNNLSPTILAVLDFQINGASIGTITANYGYGTWFSGANTTATLAIIDDSPGPVLIIARGSPIN